MFPPTSELDGLKKDETYDRGGRARQVVSAMKALSRALPEAFEPEGPREYMRGRQALSEGRSVRPLALLRLPAVLLSVFGLIMQQSIRRRPPPELLASSVVRWRLHSTPRFTPSPSQKLPAHHGGFEADWAVASCAGVLKVRSSKEAPDC